MLEDSSSSDCNALTKAKRSSRNCRIKLGPEAEKSIETEEQLDTQVEQSFENKEQSDTQAEKSIENEQLDTQVEKSIETEAQSVRRVMQSVADRVPDRVQGTSARAQPYPHPIPNKNLSYPSMCIIEG